MICKYFLLQVHLGSEKPAACASKLAPRAPGPFALLCTSSCFNLSVINQSINNHKSYLAQECPMMVPASQHWTLGMFMVEFFL